jgi:hypothetical protein
MQHDAQPTRHQFSIRTPRGPPGVRADAPIVVAPGCSTQGCVATTSGAAPEVAGYPVAGDIACVWRTIVLDAADKNVTGRW